MKQKLTLIVLMASIFLLSSVSYNVDKADRILGTYYIYKPETKSESKVQIYKTKEGKYEGKFIWLKNPNNPNGTPKLDVNNPNPKLRKQRLDNLVLIKGFKYDINYFNCELKQSFMSLVSSISLFFSSFVNIFINIFIF